MFIKTTLSLFSIITLTSTLAMASNPPPSRSPDHQPAPVPTQPPAPGDEYAQMFHKAHTPSVLELRVGTQWECRAVTGRNPGRTQIVSFRQLGDSIAVMSTDKNEEPIIAAELFFQNNSLIGSYVKRVFRGIFMTFSFVQFVRASDDGNLVVGVRYTTQAANLDPDTEIGYSRCLRVMTNQ